MLIQLLWKPFLGNYRIARATFLAAPCILFVAMTAQRRVSNSYSDVIVLLCAQSHRDNTRNPANS